MTSATNAPLSVFGDKMYTSTDLNRRGAEVFDSALERPVTISRNSDAFALMTREQASKLFRALAEFATVAGVFSAISTAKEQPQMVPEPLQWVTAFGERDLERFQSELASALQSAISEDSDWDRVSDVIHEWRESAAVAQSGVLDHAMSAEAEVEVPLPRPKGPAPEQPR